MAARSLRGDPAAARVEVAVLERARQAARVDVALEGRDRAPLAVADVDRSDRGIGEENTRINVHIINKCKQRGPSEAVDVARASTQHERDLAAGVIVLVFEIGLAG